MAAMLRMARENGIGMQLGVLVGETAVLGAAARACAFWADFRHVEFGFPALLLRGDPFTGGPDGYCGLGRSHGGRGWECCRRASTASPFGGRLFNMGGIAGIIELRGRDQTDPRVLRGMSAAIAHRGPDEEGFVFLKGLGLASRGRQPIQNEDRTVTAVLDGALFEFHKRMR